MTDLQKAKTMKLNYRIVLLVFIIFSIFKANAQEVKFQAGIGVSTIKQLWDGEPDSRYIHPAFAFHVGPSIEFTINNTFQVKSGALLQLKGYKHIFDEPHEGQPSKSEDRYKFWNLDFPLLLKTNFLLGKQNFYTEFGPYAGIGLCVKYSNTYEYLDRKEHLPGKVPIGKKYDWGIEKRGALGALFAAGTKIKNVDLGLLLDLQLSKNNAHKDNVFEHVFKHRVISVYMAIPIVKM
jgi:hypothetical protein